ncbi:hypothetical protein JOC48_003278 [Aquibacillus albus]|uniref:Fur-regulated basic protein FbpA n=2 Tax=Aquibacillus albus TaxID=1168171 RepID=A0ABS2N3P4_9BACI|nr:hypothetical protein [Aquibacillus albus]
MFQQAKEALKNALYIFQLIEYKDFEIKTQRQMEKLEKQFS